MPLRMFRWSGGAPPVRECSQDFLKYSPSSRWRPAVRVAVDHVESALPGAHGVTLARAQSAFCLPVPDAALAASPMGNRRCLYMAVEPGVRGRF